MAIFLNKILHFQRLTGQLTDKQFHDKEKPSPQIKQIKELILNFELEFHSSRHDILYEVQRHAHASE